MRRLITFAPLAGLLVMFSMVLGGCKNSTSPEDRSPYRTPASALDPEPTEEMLRHLLDSGTFHISGAYSKRHRVASFEDSLSKLVDLAVSKVSADAATHIPYVWGGKHLDAPTEWATCGCLPDDNKHCAARIGLDCSGFVQYIFEQAGFGRAAPELNCQSLAQLSNWDFIAKRGYYVFGLPKPNVSELLPGDVLLFDDGSGNLTHTGIFWSQTANINGETRPAFINSAGSSNCDTCYGRETAGRLTGVVASPLGNYWQGKLLMAIRITEWNMTFNALGYDFSVGINNGVASFVLDTLKNTLEIAGGEDSTDVSSSAFVTFTTSAINGAGTYTIPTMAFDVLDVPRFWYSGDDNTYPDSLAFYLTTPPEWWKGDPPTPEAGQVKVSVLSRGQYYGSIVGTFHFKPYTYYSRYEDSTYTIDTVTYTVGVMKYYTKQVDVTGRFAGLLGYK